MDRLRYRKPWEVRSGAALAPHGHLFVLLALVFLMLYAMRSMEAGVAVFMGRAQAQKAAKEAAAELEVEKVHMAADIRRTYEEKLDAERRVIQQEKERIQKEQELRTEIAARLRREFAKAGVQAQVDERTGEVTLPFAEVHFDYGSAVLKPAMKQVLKKAIPAYARSLLGDPRASDAIVSLEVVGFASPTYLGKYVDPSALDPESVKSLNYNMDLSYHRARSIFEFIFDRRKMRFPQQSEMLRMTKVTGLGHLQAEPPAKGVLKGRSSPKAEAFCKKYNCAANQKVVLRFSLKEAAR
ncbi:MAG TPA: hypothetical protein VL588_10365 [Bdellovibrionota bacterium]|jgi:outer membrane protein OmpA-like peptidoglycan-associated protein|nr:hypothetical protein [Bdellovibrionota bacterium]